MGAGSRTQFRVSCLFDSKLLVNQSHLPPLEREVCILFRNWWKRRANREIANNRRRVCCEKSLYSNYSLWNLQNLAEQGARFKWMRGGVGSGIKAVDDMRLGSGGNALHAAIGMCEQVNVYGAGLLSDGPSGDKIYAHAYDVSVGLCLQD